MHIEKIIQDMKENVSQHNMLGSAYNYDHMIYVRLFEGCNLHCEHCFIPNNPKKMEPEIYQNHKITQDLIDKAHVKENSKLYFQWHGGEPTLLGVDYLKNAIEAVQSDNRFEYMHGIQTNLINFHQNTDKWINLYKEHFGGELGVSWDYGIRHTRAASKPLEQTNQDYEEQFWKNLKTATEAGLNIYMVITATKVLFEHFKNPMELYQMMVDNGVTKFNFERITKTGFARENWEKLGLSNLEYSKYMSKFFKAYILFKEANPDVNLSVSPFDGLMRSVIGMNLQKVEHKEKASVWDMLSYKNQGYGCWSGECDTRFHTFDANGYKHGCTALTSEQDNSNKTLHKNVDVKKIIWIGKNNSNLAQKESIINTRKDRQLSCTGCEFLSICSSGCLSVEKFDDSGECSGAKTLFKTINSVVANKLQ